MFVTYTDLKCITVIAQERLGKQCDYMEVEFLYVIGTKFKSEIEYDQLRCKF